MQMGFNNDVPYRGLTVHIQTEDHGMRSKKITSQVFFSGAILESKTISYEADLAGLAEGADPEERVRTLMKALHKKMYQRINEGTYDGQLPLEGAADSGADASASGADAGAADGSALGSSAAGAVTEAAPTATDDAPPAAATDDSPALETPEEMLAEAGFRVAGAQSDLGPEAVERASRGAVMDDADLASPADMSGFMDDLTQAADELGAQGFVQLGGIGTGAHAAVDDGEVTYGDRAAYRGLDADDTDMGELLLAAMRDV